MQARHAEAHRLLICIAEEQAQAEHVIDHDPRRQQPRPLLYPPCLGKHVINQVTVDKTGQDPDADPVRQPDTRENCRPSSTSPIARSYPNIRENGSERPDRRVIHKFPGVSLWKCIMLIRQLKESQ